MPVSDLLFQWNFGSNVVLVVRVLRCVEEAIEVVYLVDCWINILKSLMACRQAPLVYLLHYVFLHFLIFHEWHVVELHLFSIPALIALKPISKEPQVSLE